MCRLTLPVFILLMLSFAVSAQTFNVTKMDSLFDNLATNKKAMGSLLVSNEKGIVYDKSIGFASINGANRSELSRRTKYRIGSVTKMFTAVLVFQLIENKKLGLDTKLSVFFKQLPKADQISIGHLLSHQSGLYNYTENWDSWRFKRKSQDQIISIIAKGPPAFDPGTKTAYSNSNYIILGYIIEKLTSKPYGQVLKQEIVSKLGLTDTYYGGAIDPANGEAFSYSLEKGSWVNQPQTDASAAGGAGAIISSTNDLTRFIEALFDLRLISEESLKNMLRFKDGEGMGIQQLPFFDEVLYGHSGQIDYFQSYLLYFPKHKLSLVYISNGFGGVSINQILSGVLHIYFNKEFVLPDFRSATLTDEETDAYLGTFTDTASRMTIVIKKEGNQLYGQAQGQNAFPLEALGASRFKFDPAGITIDFNSEKTGFILKQGKGTYQFSKTSFQ